MSSDNAVQTGHVQSSYFWDDGSGINGDTGAPASGKPMQEGLFASPSWPMGTEGYVEYNGKKEHFFVGDRGPGDPAGGCDTMLDMDGKTFAKLVGEDWNPDSLTVDGGEGHLDVKYTVTKWGEGDGTPGAPHPMSNPSQKCHNVVDKTGSELAADRKAEAKRKAEEKKEQQQKLQNKKEDEYDEAVKATQRKQEEQREAKDKQAAPGHGDGGNGPHQGTQAQTAADDLSGMSLASNDLPLASGALLLALLPAVIVALIFAKRPSWAYSTDGRHRLPSLLTAEGRHEARSRAREGWRATRSWTAGAWSDARTRAVDTWRRLTAGSGE